MVDPLLQSILVGISIILLATLSYLVLKKKIRERDSFLWYMLLFLLLFFSVFYKLTDYISHVFKIHYSLSLFFLLGILALFILGFYHSYKISKLTNKLTELTQQVALLNCINRPADEVKKNKT